jgi:hypothetical protein
MAPQIEFALIAGPRSAPRYRLRVITLTVGFFGFFFAAAVPAAGASSASSASPNRASRVVRD